jgi:hypothetical protein
MTQNICNVTLLGKKNSRGSGNDLNAKEKFQRIELFYSKVKLEIVEKVSITLSEELVMMISST